MKIILTLLFIGLFGCGDDSVIYSTKCPLSSETEHYGYVNIPEIKENKIAFWACVQDKCFGDIASKHRVYITPAEGRTLKVCCGKLGDRVDEVNLVVYTK